jgi:hypothetical protein
MKSYVCITAWEWRNLCSRGRIRLQESRAVPTAQLLSSGNYHALFSLAADRFSLGETSEFLITECSGLQSEIEGIHPPGHEVGIRWLLLQDVIRFFPLRADDAWAFEADARKARVGLGEASLEYHWSQWFKAQVADQACIDGLTLRRILGFGDSTNLHETGSAYWRAIASQIAVPNAEGPDASDFFANFVVRQDRLFEFVREDADSGAFFVSCPIEWINLRSDIHIFEADAALAEQAQRLHEKYRNVAFEPSLACAEDIKEFETLLLAKAPEAFPGVWRPAMISLYARYSHRIRFGSLAPDDIVASVRAIDTPDDRRAAEMLAFLFGVALGSNKTHSLERSIDPQKFAMVSLPVVDTTPTQVPPVAETNPIPIDLPLAHSSTVKISRMTEADLRGILGEFHVLTYAEEGFSPLDIHAQRLGVDREEVKAFAKAVNDQADVGSLYPLAPISAVPRDLVRSGEDVGALAASICNFFRANRATINARRLIFDFRTPAVPGFVLEALSAAIQSDVDPGLEEILILEMQGG